MAAQQKPEPEPGTAMTAPVEGAQEKAGLLRLLEAKRSRIDPFLPPGYTLERVAASAYLAIRDNPALADCTPESLIRAIAKTQQWGLEIGETAHLVPFNVKVKRNGQEEWESQAKAIADYKGLIELIIRSGVVRAADVPRCVYKDEAFEFSQGLEPRLHHVPSVLAEQRGELVGAYWVVRMPGGHPVFEYMPLSDIDAIRQQYSKQWKKGPCPPWYAKKTVVRQVAKILPKNARLRAALAVIEDEEREEFGEPGAEADALPSAPTTRTVSRPAPVRALPMPSPHGAGVAPVAYEDEATPARSGEVRTVVANNEANPRALARAMAEPDPYETVEQTVQVKRCRECGGTIDAKGRGHSPECRYFADVFDDDEEEGAPAGSGSSASPPAPEPELPLQGARETQGRRASGRMPKPGAVQDAILPREDGDPF